MSQCISSKKEKIIKNWPGPAVIVLAVSSSVHRRIRALPSDGPRRFRNPSAVCPLASEIVSRLTFSLGRVSVSNCSGRPLTDTGPVPKAVR